MTLARLLKRVFKSDLAACPDCGGELKIAALADPCARGIHASLHIIAAITQPSAINKLLTHFGLPTRALAKFHLTHSFDF